jgi:hypothetical protein
MMRWLSAGWSAGLQARIGSSLCNACAPGGARSNLLAPE